MSECMYVHIISDTVIELCCASVLMTIGAAPTSAVATVATATVVTAPDPKISFQLESHHKSIDATVHTLYAKLHASSSTLK
jgi:hypothetical protein